MPYQRHARIDRRCIRFDTMITRSSSPTTGADRDELAYSGTEEAYRQRVMRCLIDELTDGPKSLNRLVQACRGAFPTVVLECLHELRSGIIPTFTSAWSLASCASDRPLHYSPLARVEGNPILSSWYFTDRTCQALGELRDWHGLRIAFLGTPKLYEWFRRHDLGAERVLLDLDDVVLRCLAQSDPPEHDALHCYDVADGIPPTLNQKYDCVFFDPPWYSDQYEIWLYRAFQLVSSGFVYFSLFPDLTRPSAAAEREELLARVRSSARSSWLCSSFLSYEVPSYERQQLRHAGLSDITSWRSGDLVVAEISTNTHFGEPLSITSSLRWIEIDIGSVRIFVNPKTAPDRSDHSLLSLPPGSSAVLPSPGRRHWLEDGINVLTSRGHGMITYRPMELISMLRELASSMHDGQASDGIPPSFGARLDPTALMLLHEIVEG